MERKHTSSYKKWKIGVGCARHEPTWVRLSDLHEGHSLTHEKLSSDGKVTHTNHKPVAKVNII